MALGLTPQQIIDKGTHPLLEISEEWERVELKFIARVQNGYAFSSRLFNHSEGLPLIRIRDIFSKETENLYSGEYKEEFVVNNGDILIGMDGDFKVSKWLGKKGLLNQRVCRIHFNSNFYNKRFLFLCIQPYLDAIHSETSAVTVKHLSSRTINNISFPLPPLVIQHAIVNKVEELFSSLDSGIADLKKAQEQLKIYRQAVLKNAFEGELTSNVKKPRIVRLGSLIEKPRYGTSKKCTLKKKGKAVLRIPNIGNGIIDATELKYAEFEEKEIASLGLKEGDILIIRSNGSVDLVGKCAIITKKDVNFLYAGYLIRIRPNLIEIDSKYLLYCLSSHNLRVQIESKAKSTSGVNNINSGELESLEIPLFSKKEQLQIVQQVESRLSVCDAVEQNITDSLEKAQALRQSILKKAFEGSLLSDEEIAACKSHVNYEPASVLLNKIKKDKKNG